MTAEDIAASVARYEKDPMYASLMRGEIPQAWEGRASAWIGMLRDLADRCEQVRPDLAVVWRRCMEATERRHGS